MSLLKVSQTFEAGGAKAFLTLQLRLDAWLV